MARGQETAYQTLATELRNSILQGKYAHGEALPTEAELVRQHSLSRQTVRRAFQELVSADMVYRVPGRGTFASPPDRQYLRQFGSIEELMGLSLDTELELVEPLASRVNVAAAGRLRVDADVVSMLRFRRLHDGQPFCITDTYFPLEVGQQLTDLPELTVKGTISRITVIGVLDDRLESTISEADQSITAVSAASDIAAALNCLVGAPLLRIDRVYRDSTGRPVELAVSYFLPDLYSYRVQLRRNSP
jgi:GntR family transcriptional regulator